MGYITSAEHRSLSDIACENVTSALFLASLLAVDFVCNDNIKRCVALVAVTIMTLSLILEYSHTVVYLFYTSHSALWPT